MLMYEYMKTHEKFIVESLKDETTDFNWLSTYHETQIQFLQHERFIHLIITIFFALLLIGSVVSTLVSPIILLFVLDLILFILLLFYIRHYYRLENGVQYWYALYNDIERKKGTLKS